MEQTPSQEAREAQKELLQRVIDDLLYYSDLLETHQLPAREGASALRMVAGLFSLQRDLT